MRGDRPTAPPVSGAAAHPGGVVTLFDILSVIVRSGPLTEQNPDKEHDGSEI